jgi:glycosyltransferase involved in cell wall biosynthesis
MSLPARGSSPASSDLAPAAPPGPGSRINVLLVVSTLEYGGSQRQVVELANSLDPHRFDVHVCSLSSYAPLGALLRDRERRFHVIEKRHAFDATVVPRLVALLRRLRTHVVQGYLFDAEIATALAGRLARTPLVVGSERNSEYVFKTRHLVAYRLTRACVDLVIANSHVGAAFNSRMLGRDPAIYRVVHNGVDSDRFAPGDRLSARQALGLGPEAYVIGMLASFKPQKDHALAFRAIVRVLPRAPSLRLLLVGDFLYGGQHDTDEHKRRLIELVADLGLEQHCLFLGNRDDVERVYAACDVTLLTSRYEGTPNVVLESMACGVPVVATAAGDVPTLVPDGQAGFVVPLGDEEALAARLGQLHDDPALRQRLGRQARQWVEQEFTLSRLAERTGHVFLEALKIRGMKKAATAL